MQFPCPKCGLQLDQSGIITVDDAEYPVFQCEQCTKPQTIFAGHPPQEVALTFIVKDGKAVDPADAE